MQGFKIYFSILILGITISCKGPEGDPGPIGQQGKPGINGSPGSSDKEIRFPLGSVFGYHWLSTPFKPTDTLITSASLILFNKTNYINVDSIIYIIEDYTIDVNKDIQDQIPGTGTMTAFL